MAQEEEDKSCLEERFHAAVRVIRSLPADGPYQPSDDMMLMFYSYYKQATLGPCNMPRPNGFWDTAGKAKWDAWSSLGKMTKHEAMQAYVDDIQLILETIPVSDEVSDLVEILGNFFTEVDGGITGGGGGEEEEEMNEQDKRPFTRPFASATPAGYGGLWEDLQNHTEKEKEICVHDLAVREKGEETDEMLIGGILEHRADSSDMEEETEGVLCDDDDDHVEDAEDEAEEEEERTGTDSRLLTVEDSSRAWRFDTRGSSSSSAEPSLSSVNGTHSSLNSEVEEDELACSVERPGKGSRLHRHLNGHRSDCSAAKFIHRANDSDNEEYCDSMEHLAMEEVKLLPAVRIPSSGPRSCQVRRKDLQGGTNMALSGGEGRGFVLEAGLGMVRPISSLSSKGKGSRTPGSGCGSPMCVTVATDCRCTPESRHSGCGPGGVLDEQVAMALLRLQDDMANVIHRLQSLESRNTSQTRFPSSNHKDSLQLFQRPSWWPFHLSPLAVVFTTVWPLLAHGLLTVYLQRKRRKN